MRQKTEKTVVSFLTTADAMRFEKICIADGITGRLIPTPREISADCGFSWASPADECIRVHEAIETHKLEHDGIYQLWL